MKRNGILSVIAISATVFLASCGGAEAPKTTEEVTPAVTEEVAPVKEEVVVEEVVATPTADADLTNGEEVYKKSCFACHDAGVAGAAKLDDKARWDATAAKGLETVNNNAVAGFTGENGVMPAKGGNASFTDDEVKNAVAYMLNTAGVTAE